MASLKAFFSIIFFLIAGDLAFAGSAKGKLVFDSSSIRLGEIQRGETVKAVFPFHASGDKSVTIEGVHTGCGCLTTNDVVGKSFKNGASGFIEVEFDSSHFSGKVLKKIVVMTDRNRLSSKTLHLHATVKSDLFLDPPVVVLNKKNGYTSKVSIISKNRVEGFEVELKANSSDALIVDSLQKTGDSYDFVVKLNSDYKFQNVMEDVIVLTNHPSQKQLVLKVRHQKEQLLSDQPYIEFGGVREKGTVSKTLKLNSNDILNKASGQLNLVSAEIFVDGQKIDNGMKFFEVESISEKFRSDGRHSFKIHLNRSEEARVGAVKGKLVIRFSGHTAKSVFNIPIYGYFL